MFRTKEQEVVGRNMWVKGDGVYEINKVKYCYTKTNACNTYGCNTRTNHTKIQLPLRYVSKREDFAR